MPTGLVVKGIEDPGQVGLGDPASCVRKFHDQHGLRLFSLESGADSDDAPSLFHGVEGVVDQIEEDLLELRLGHSSHGKARLELGLNGYAGIFGALGRQADDFF